MSGERAERVKGLGVYFETKKPYGTAKTVMVSVKIPLSIYIMMTELIDAGVYASISDFVRHACRNEVAKWTELFKNKRMLG